MGGIMILTAIDLRAAVGLPVQSVRLVRTGGAGRLRCYWLVDDYRKVVRKDTKGLIARGSISGCR